MSDIVIVQETLQSVGLGKYFRVSEKGLEIVGQPSFDQCEALWETLVTVHQTIQIAIGDAMKYFRERWGVRADQIISARTGWSLSTLHVYENTAKSIAPENRRFDALSYSHHQAVVALPPREQKRWLDKAAEGEDGQPWPVRRLKAAVKAGGDLPVQEYGFVAFIADERKRDDAQRELEGRGFRCTATEKR